MLSTTLSTEPTCMEKPSAALETPSKSSKRCSSRAIPPSSGEYSPDPRCARDGCSSPGARMPTAAETRRRWRPVGGLATCSDLSAATRWRAVCMSNWACGRAVGVSACRISFARWAAPMALSYAAMSRAKPADISVFSVWQSSRSWPKRCRSIWYMVMSKAPCLMSTSSSWTVASRSWMLVSKFAISVSLVAKLLVQATATSWYCVSAATFKLSLLAFIS
mmetsp:Transcript_16300/g.56892  ORF Transcript_16300/g.56892 Transcript_16300/m.56892 type:complete len:220 (-) Transcript_16300:355-1014(-)